jgi:hypothetical protein
MIAFVSADSVRLLRLVRPQVRVVYRGGRDEIIAGPEWGWRTQELRFCFGISVSGGGKWTARRLGGMDIEDRLVRRLRRVLVPAEGRCAAGAENVRKCSLTGVNSQLY